ncbi:MAG TPA: deoxynucleoside kinase [Anaerolineae bacterium]|nr:deoxynucleoside kinase [Anaerolineae bacterium]
MNDHYYIAVEGPIGVGKTTLARILQEELHGQVLFEVFEENPFLGDFYADRARYAFQTQIFFLLSRYRQQHETVARLLARGPLFADYLFAKDRLFAQLNLAGDELAVYEHVHAALGEQVIAPGLVIHLRATTDVLMNRIAVRDRPYERTMSRQYIDDLRVAYERFFADYSQGPVLNIDTTDLNFVADADDRRHLISLVRSALQSGSYQQSLPTISPSLPASGAPVMADPSPRRLSDFQELHRSGEGEDLEADLFLDYLGLTEQVGALGSQLKRLWIPRIGTSVATSDGRADFRTQARAALRDELTDAFSSLLKIANDAGIDLESAYVDRLDLESTGPGPTVGGGASK